MSSPTPKITTGGWGRDRTVDLTIFSRALVPTELPSQQKEVRPLIRGGRLPFATQTRLELATSAVTGRRANQLRYWALT
jgi:integrase